MMQLRLLAAALMILLAACQAKNNAGVGAVKDSAASSAATSAPEDSTPLQVPTFTTPRQINSAEVYVHRGTGLKFPSVAAGYSRTTLFTLDADEMDVSANYPVRRSAGLMAFSVYIYPITGSRPGISGREARDPATCRTHLDQVVNDALSIFDNPTIVAEESAPSPVDSTQSGHHVVLRAEGHPMLSQQGMEGPLRSEIYLFCNIKTLWILKYRITYPEKMEARAVIDDLIAAVPAR